MQNMQRGRPFFEAAVLHRGTRLFSIDSSKQRTSTFQRQQASIFSQHISPVPIQSRQETFKVSRSVYGQSGSESVEPQEKRVERRRPRKQSAKAAREEAASYVILDSVTKPIHPVWLRDACPCSQCVNPSTTQKNFQSTDIPPDIKTASVERLENEDVKITWENDVPGFESHVSIYPKAFFDTNRYISTQRPDRSAALRYYVWNRSQIEQNLKFATYEQWMSDDDYFGRAILDLQDSGIFIVRGVPDTETAVEDLAKRMGPIRDSLYGRTWDVKSVPDAKNVAYTQTHLGLHMDLLYMADPPGFQFLHCLQNSCEGGESIFADAFAAAAQLCDEDFARLDRAKMLFHYRNAGEHYYHSHHIFETFQSPLKGLDKDTEPKGVFGYHRRPWLKAINYSPPFQAPVQGPVAYSTKDYADMMRPLRVFAKLVEAPRNLFEYKLSPGECVIFNNRRILHGRKQFEAVGGQRWLKGAYVDTDAFESRLRTTIESGLQRSSKAITEPVFPDASQEMGGHSPKEQATLRREKRQAKMQAAEESASEVASEAGEDDLSTGKE